MITIIAIAFLATIGAVIGFICYRNEPYFDHPVARPHEGIEMMAENGKLVHFRRTFSEQEL